MPDLVVALGLVAIGIILAVAWYAISRMAVADELDARGIKTRK